MLGGPRAARPPPLARTPPAPSLLTATASIFCRSLGSVSLVSKRCHALCLAPLLVREVSVSIRSEDNAEARVQNLRDWLAANEPAIADFSFLDCLETTEIGLPLLMDFLATLCSVAPLQQLSVDFGYGSPPQPTLDWLLLVQGTLRQLRLDASSTPVAVDVPLQEFTGLSALTVLCSGMVFAAGCWLPSSLTNLFLSNLAGLPNQVSLLAAVTGGNVHTRRHTRNLSPAPVHWGGCRSSLFPSWQS